MCSHTARRTASGALVAAILLSLSAPLSVHAAEPVCGCEEHQHTSVCYETVQALDCSLEDILHHVHDSSCQLVNGAYSCGYASQVVHTHDQNCYSGGTLVCTLPEYAIHEHDASCYSSSLVLTCKETENLGHTHDDGCYMTTQVLACFETEGTGHIHDYFCQDQVLVCWEDHEHTADCYETQIVCGIEEGSGHIHTDDCYVSEKTLACGLAEGPAGHVHLQSCYSSVSTLTCGAGDKELHTHTSACYSDGVLVCGKEELLRHQHSAACFAGTSKLACSEPEHMHTADCYPEEAKETETANSNISLIIFQISALPSADEVFETLSELDAAEAQAYCEEVLLQMEPVYELYEGLSGEEQAQVTNAEEFLSLYETLYELSTRASSVTLASSSTADSFGNNLYWVDLTDSYSESANVIVINNNMTNLKTWSANYGVSINYDLWYEARVEKRNGVYSVIQFGSAANTMATQVSDGFLVLLKKDYVDSYGKYLPYAHWPEGVTGDHATASDGDTVSLNGHYLAFYPKYLEDGVSGSRVANANGVTDAVTIPKSDAISFQLFDYSTNINKLNSSFRPISSYFTFRGVGSAIPDPAQNTTYDQDGFTNNHATVERTLDENGYPVLAFDRYADGSEKTTPKDSSGNELFSYDDRKIDYLFGGRSDPEVTVYQANNTILQYDASTKTYWYDSAQNAVDYNTSTNTFYVRGYVERNATTAGYGDADDYFDFLPFNYTNGVVTGADASNGNTYNLDTADVDYWFGMRMDINFMQMKNGMFDQHEMVFNFSGDDDVWVFIDDVLVLDLGGTHGAVTGSINFATGEVKQYLDWNGTIGVDGVTSFDTTIYDCFVNAGVTPTDGWKQNAAGSNIFEDYTSHKLSFFYMERGAAVANCAFDFCLPIVENNSLSISKEVSAGEDATVLGNPDYLFQVLRAEEDGTLLDDLFIKAGTPYKVYSADGTLVSSDNVVEDNGIIRIKRGQTAVLDELPENSGSYYCRELIDDSLSEQYGSVDVNGTIETFDHDVLVGEASFAGSVSQIRDMSDGDSSFDFQNNVISSELGSLSIYKEVWSKEDGATLETFNLYIEVDDVPLAEGTPYFVDGEPQVVSDEGYVHLTHGQEVLIPNILIGSRLFIQERLEIAGVDIYLPVYSGESLVEGSDEHGPYVAYQILSKEEVHVDMLNKGAAFVIQLPTSGGSGTETFYLIGCLTLAGALLFIKRRVSHVK